MKQQGSDTAANPIRNIPKQVFFTKGRGTHKDYLTSFELALRDADIADLNLVSVSSILPPHCKVISRQEGRYLSEHHSTGETAQKAGDYAEDMAMEMLATTLGLPNDPSLAWSEKEEQWRLSNKIYKTQNFTQSAEGHKDGLWTTVISGAVLIL